MNPINTRAEQTPPALQLNEAYFRHLIEDALDLITVLNVQGNIRFVSRSLAAQLGWESEDMLGRSAFEDHGQLKLNALTRVLRGFDGKDIIGIAQTV